MPLCRWIWRPKWWWWTSVCILTAMCLLKPYSVFVIFNLTAFVIMCIELILISKQSLFLSRCKTLSAHVSNYRITLKFRIGFTLCASSDVRWCALAQLMGQHMWNWFDVWAWSFSAKLCTTCTKPTFLFEIQHEWHQLDAPSDSHLLV